MDAQVTPATTADTTGSPIIVLNADETEGKEQGAKMDLYGNVLLRQDSIFIRARHVFLATDSNFASADGEIIIQKDDSTSAFANELKFDGNQHFATLIGDVVLQNKTNELFGDKLYYYTRKNEASYDQLTLMTNKDAFLSSKLGTFFIDSNLIVLHDSVVIKGPDYILKTDSIHFHTDSRKLIFVAPTRTVYKNVNLYSEAGWYDLNTNDGLLIKNAQYQSNDTRAQADSILYFGASGDVQLLGHAQVQKENQKVSAQEIFYEEQAQKVRALGNVRLLNKEGVADSDEIIYFLDSETYHTAGATSINMNGTKLSALSVFKDPVTEWIVAHGAVLLVDTVNNFFLEAEHLEFHEEKEAMQAGGEELLLGFPQKEDTLFVSSDTLFTIERFWSDPEHKLALDTVNQDSIGLLVKVVPSDSVQQILVLHQQVVGFSNEAQFICDTMFFNRATEVLFLHEKAMVWRDTAQFQANQIELITENEQPKEMWLRKQAAIVQSPDKKLFNQIAGNLIHAVLDSGIIQKVLVEGNAQAVYYPLDENGAYVGLNDLDCAAISAYFVNNKLDRLVSTGSPTAIMYPMSDEHSSKVALKEYMWTERMRPKSKEDVFILRKNY